MADRWSFETIDWSCFDPEQVDGDMLCLVKAAAMVESNSADYVTYLKNVLPDQGDLHPILEQWGREEARHGAVLARWAALADPTFDFAARFRQFTDGYRIPLDATASVRGSQAGELVARCIVEVGTSSFYSAIRDAATEPLLKQIAGLIAADEVRHYSLFRRLVGRFEALSKWRRLRVAAGRIAEAEDDELSFAYYCANLSGADTPYERAVCAHAYWRRAMALYRRHHIERGMTMFFKASGFDPQGRLPRLTSAALWRLTRWRVRRLARRAA